MRKIVEALKKSGLYKNSIIVFSSDNGGACQSCSFPLRGGKAQLYEGGVRAVGFIHSPLIKKPKGIIQNKKNPKLLILDPLDQNWKLLSNSCPRPSPKRTRS